MNPDRMERIEALYGETLRFQTGNGRPFSIEPVVMTANCGTKSNLLAYQEQAETYLTGLRFIRWLNAG
jgi:hypothetical protein